MIPALRVQGARATAKIVDSWTILGTILDYKRDP